MTIYLDDIAVFSKTREEHNKHLWQTLNTLQKHQKVAKSSKCVFYKPELLFLGHTIPATGIKSNPAKVEAISKIPPQRMLEN